MSRRVGSLTPRLDLFRADRICRRLWPGLLPPPVRHCEVQVARRYRAAHPRPQARGMTYDPGQRHRARH
jgi:hypothetical protein